jgi:lipopolysaccharide export system permease protein
MIIERYFLKEALQYWILGILLFIFAVLGVRFIRVIDMLLDRGISIVNTFKLITLLLPSFLLYIIPIAILFGVLITLSRMSADKELLALKTCGISIISLIKPIIFFCSMGAILTASLTFYIVPISMETFKDKLFKIAEESFKPRAKEKVFYSIFPKVILYVDEINKDGILKNVMIFDERKSEAKTFILAQKGWIERDEEGSLIFHLEKGELHQEDKEAYSIMRFESYVFRFSPEEVLKEVENKAQVKLLEKELSLKDLKEKIKMRIKEGKDPRPQLVELHFKFALPFSAFVVGLLGLGLGTQRTRSGRSFGLVLSLFTMVLYYTLFLQGKALASAGVIPPWMGAWLSNIVISLIGIYLFRKSQTESSVKILEILEHGFEVLKKSR